MISLILGEYLRGLKERDELDYILPLLLDQMGYKIIKTPNSSRGQSEYGNDVTAIEVDEDGKGKKVIFQIKAGSDRNIDTHNFDKKNGIRESLLQIMDYDFNDKSNQELNELPLKIILVHNGEIHANCVLLLNGFLEKNVLGKGVEFDRWDIFKLTEYFEKYLFNEYLLVKHENVSLLKKALTFLDDPETDNRNFKILVDDILNDQKEYNENKYRKFIFLLGIISEMVLHHSREINNLEPAKDCLTYLLLKTWGWILEKKKESDDNAVSNFWVLNMIHYRMLNEYFAKTLEVAKETDGLYSERGGDFEKIGYPMRCFEYLGYLIYFYQIDEIIAKIRRDDYSKPHKIAIEYLKNIIFNNSGCSRPLLDNHSIPILLVLKYLIDNDEKKAARAYLYKIINNLSLIKYISHRLPELYNNVDSLIEFVATGVRPRNYVDNSSYLINMLFEFSVILDFKEVFDENFEILTKNLILLSYKAPENIVEKEHILFQKELIDEGSSLDCSYNLNKSLSDGESLSYEKYCEIFRKLETKKFSYKSDSSEFRPLRFLTHVYFKTPLFSDEWRQ